MKESIKDLLALNIFKKLKNKYFLITSDKEFYKRMQDKQNGHISSAKHMNQTRKQNPRHNTLFRSHLTPTAEHDSKKTFQRVT